MQNLPPLDLGIFLAFLLGVIAFGCSFYFRKGNSAENFVSGGGKLPAWAVGMSIFATFVSSISFLALPAKAYSSNWNAFVFSLTIPFAAILAAKFFVPLYRELGSPSAYAYLEKRFGVWARTYASVCYLLTQLSRMGAILYLLALPMQALLGWSVQTIILATGIGVAAYSMMGGISAVIWTDAIEGIILIAGALVCFLLLLWGMPGDGLASAFHLASDAHKFSLGSFTLLDWGSETFWVCFVYGLFINLQNYGIDQNYIQRYLTAKNKSDAIKSTLFGSLLYVPVSWLFFLIGTALFAYYQLSPQGALPPGVAEAPDKVFPWFIAHGLPTGLRGLLAAAIFAAGMSTVSTSLNSGATIILEDFWKRFVRKNSVGKGDLAVLRASTVALAALGVGFALAMMRVQSALDAWWALASIFSGGMLGLFLLGFCCKKASSSGALIGAVAGIVCICLIVFGQDVLPFQLHKNLAIVFGTTAIVVVGFILSSLRAKRIECSRTKN